MFSFVYFMLMALALLVVLVIMVVVISRHCRIWCRRSYANFSMYIYSVSIKLDVLLCSVIGFSLINDHLISTLVYLYYVQGLEISTHITILLFHILVVCKTCK